MRAKGPPKRRGPPFRVCRDKEKISICMAGTSGTRSAAGAGDRFAAEKGSLALPQGARPVLVWRHISGVRTTTRSDSPQHVNWLQHVDFSKTGAPSLCCSLATAFSTTVGIWSASTYTCGTAPISRRSTYAAQLHTLRGSSTPESCTACMADASAPQYCASTGVG